MIDVVVKAYKTNILKVYAVVYSLVAIPVAYYGINYIELIYKNFSLSVPLLGLVMVISVVAAIIVQYSTNKRITRFLKGGSLSDSDLSALKLDASKYPFRLVGVMFFGWVVLVNLLCCLPLFFIFNGSLSDLVTCNLLVISSGLVSIPMTYFISEKTVGTLLCLEALVKAPEPKGILRLSLTTKILVVCLIIIVSLILNTTAAMVLSVSYNLSHMESIVNLLVISATGIIDSIIISLLFARSLKMPIANISAGTEQLKKGDLTASLPCLSNDELGDSSVSYNSFVDTLADIVKDIKISLKKTTENVGELQRAMGNTNSSVEDIHRFSTQVQSSITNQSAIVTEVTATIQQIARTIENQDKRINDQSSSVVESSSAIEQMIANIQSISVNLKNSAREFESLQSAISVGNKNIDELKANVIVLSKQSDSVFEANNIIKNIASQTNLLAMNAAIEAAHAGEAGQGFAVVADEIRKLAELSNQQSKLISDSLKVLKRTIEQSVAMTGNTGASFDVIISSVRTVNGLELEIKQAIDEQSSGGSQILRALSGMNEITSEVHNGSNEMLKGSNMILVEVKNLLGITEEVTSSAFNVVEKAQTVKNNTKEAMTLLERNTENIQRIDEKVGFFNLQ